MEDSGSALEAAGDVMWGDFGLEKLLETVQEKSADGLLILFNMLLTCTYYISTINSN